MADRANARTQTLLESIKRNGTADKLAQLLIGKNHTYDKPSLHFRCFTKFDWSKEIPTATGYQEVYRPAKLQFRQRQKNREVLRQ